MNRCVIFDIDGTLCLLEESTKPYSHTGEEVLNDHIYEELIDEWSLIDIDIIILTGRKFEDHHETTIEWLDKHKIPYDHLIMCKDGQPEENHIFKKRVLRVLSQMYDKIMMVYDDNTQMSEVCRKLKIPFYQV